MSGSADDAHFGFKKLARAVNQVPVNAGRLADKCGNYGIHPAHARMAMPPAQQCPLVYGHDGECVFVLKGEQMKSILDDIECGSIELITDSDYQPMLHHGALQRQTVAEIAAEERERILQENERRGSRR